MRAGATRQARLPTGSTMRKPPPHVPSPRRGTRAVPVTATELPNGEEKRERILAVAEELFYRYGYRGTTLDMICDALHTTKPFVYYYFRNKQEIFETLTWRASVACLTTMKFAADDARPADVKLAQGVRKFAAACVANFRSGALAYRDTASLRAEFNASLRRLAREFYRDLCSLMEEGRAAGRLSFGDTELTARAMVSVGAFMYAWYTPKGRVPPETTARELTNTMLKMVSHCEAIE